MAPIPKTATNATLRGASMAARRFAWPLLLTLSTTACSTLNWMERSILGGPAKPVEGQAGYVKGFVGQVVTDEPRAALTGRDILSAGGNAADAAVATALALSVTLPSRAGLGGGGVCLAYTASTRGLAKGAPEAIMFEAPPARAIGGGDRPAAVPSLGRGMFLLHARHGKLPFELLIAKAEQLARFGVPVSRALARDLAIVAGPLLADPGARAVFGTGSTTLAEGQGLIQPDLAATLTQLRVSGVGGLHQGLLARRVEDVSPSAGVPIGQADLRAAIPQIGAPAILAYREDKVAFPPTAGGIGAAAAFKSIMSQPSDLQTAWMRGLAAAERWRAGGANSDQVLNADLPAPAVMPLYPASTTFATLDPDGNAVICALSMNNLFGTGRMVPGLGFLAAASPARVTPPLLAVALAWNEYGHAFHGAAGGSGQGGAPLAAATALYGALKTGQAMPGPVPDPGRANTIFCGRYLPGSESSCSAAADPRESGLASGGQ